MVYLNKQIQKHKDNISRYLKDNWLWCVIILIPLVVTSAFRIATLINEKFPNLDINYWCHLDNNAWLSFWGSYIGGVCTLFAMIITIKFEKNNRQEEKRLSVLPYLMFRISECEYTFDTSTYKYGENVKNDKLMASMNYIEILGSKKENDKKYIKHRSYFKLTCKNVGIKSAIDIKILRISTNFINTISVMQRDILDVNDMFKYLFELHLNKENRGCKDVNDEITFVINFKDILGNNYIQEVTIPYYTFCNESTSKFYFRVGNIINHNSRYYSKSEYKEFIDKNYEGHEYITIRMVSMGNGE